MCAHGVGDALGQCDALRWGERVGVEGFERGALGVGEVAVNRAGQGLVDPIGRVDEQEKPKAREGDQDGASPRESGAAHAGEAGGVGVGLGQRAGALGAGAGEV